MDTRYQVFVSSWAQIFAAIAPELQEYPLDATVQRHLGKALHRITFGRDLTATINVDEEDFQTIRVQLSALGLIKATYQKTVQGGMGYFWSLTEAGEQKMFELRTVKPRA